MGPWTLAYHLHGLQPFLTKTLLEPEIVVAFLQRLKEITLAFGRAQIIAGADVLCLADHATGDLVRSTMYRDFLQPVHKELIAGLGCPIVLHICGDTLDRIGHIVDAGFDAFHFDSKVDARAAVDAVGGRMSLVGNVIANVDSVAGLSGLTVLDISGNDLTDISPLGGLTNLANLDISNNNLTDISPLGSLTTLQELSAGGNSITDASALAAMQSIEMATMHGARALGLDQETGSLLPGKSADIIAFDLNSIETQPVYHPESHVVYAASRDKITDVWINGQHVLNQRQLTRMDQNEILQKAQSWQHRIRKT